MKKVFKYQLVLDDYQSIKLPEGAEILYCNQQNEVPMIWALIDFPWEKLTERHIRISGTGHPIDSNIIKYIGSYLERVFVWHIFEIEDPKLIESYYYKQ